MAPPTVERRAFVPALGDGAAALVIVVGVGVTGPSPASRLVEGSDDEIVGEGMAVLHQMFGVPT